MQRDITIAENIGFCAGARNAIDKALDGTARYRRIAMLGAIVHNEKVINDLAQNGVEIIESLHHIPADEPLLLRAHGTPLYTRRKAEERGQHIIDATCPLVKQIHRAAKQLETDGRLVIIIGDHGHEEVAGIASRLSKPMVIANVKEAAALHRYTRLGVVVQSTQNLAEVKQILNVLFEKTDDLHFINTICKPTRQRQEQIRQLAREKDVMIIVGSATSANTRRLTKISKQLNPHTYQVNNAAEVQEKWIKSAQSVGISAGASTPSSTVEAVAKRIAEIP